MVGGINRSQNAKNLNIYIINLLSNIKNKTGGKLIAIAVADKLINIVVNEFLNISFIEILILLNVNISERCDKFNFEEIKKFKIKKK